MLTKEEQDAVLKKVQAIRMQDVRLRRMVAQHEMSPRRCHELKQKSEDELRDLLKEIG